MVRRIQQMKAGRYEKEEAYQAMKKFSLFFNVLLVSLSMILVVLGFTVKIQTGTAHLDPLKPDRQILQDLSLVMIMVGLLVAVLNLVLLSLVRTEHVLSFTLAIIMVVILIVCELTFFFIPTIVSRWLVHKNMLMTSYDKDDITFDEEAKIVFPSSQIGIRWSFVQFAFRCCGFSGADDYDLVDAGMRLGRAGGRVEQMSLPLSCCKFKVNFKFFTDHVISRKTIQRCLISDPEAFHTHGCFGINWKSMSMMTSILTILLILTIATQIVQLIIFGTLVVKKSPSRSH